MNATPFLPIRIKLTLLISLFFFTTACGDFTSGAGEFGRVIYSLYSHYVVKESKITEVSILAGYPQEIRTTLTNKGSEDIEKPGTLSHKIFPSEGVSVLSLDDGYASPP